MQYSVPTINFLLGWLLYSEPMPATRLIGFALVWVGLALVTVDTVRRTRRSGRSLLGAGSQMEPNRP
jgi:chloramphenicol-sensitive protein RarD